MTTPVPPPVPIRVLFVCLGNICRSPLAEGVFRHLAEQRGVAAVFEIDSAGTSGYHRGEPPDARMRAVAEANGVSLGSRARQVTAADFERFDHILCMDESNRRTLLDRGAPRAKTCLLLAAAGEANVREVPDPYFGGNDGFETVYRLVHGACGSLLDALLAEQEPR